MGRAAPRPAPPPPMAEPACLFALLYADREQHETVLEEILTPAVREFRGRPELDSLFFARYNEPRWQVRFRVLGRPEWVEGPVRERVTALIAPLEARGVVEGSEFARYQREYERYGGPEGMALAERIFLQDTLFCLDYLDAERRGAAARTRREVSLLLTHRFLDLMGFDRPARIEFYRYGYRWALEMKTWQEEELALLDEHYRSVRDGLAGLLFGGGDPVEAWGGEEPAALAERCLADTRPAVDGLRAALAAGRIPAHPVQLAWSYTHMSCNRLGIDPGPEAILRYFMHRLLTDEAVSSA